MHVEFRFVLLSVVVANTAATMLYEALGVPFLTAKYQARFPANAGNNG